MEKGKRRKLRKKGREKKKRRGRGQEMEGKLMKNEEGEKKSYGEERKMEIRSRRRRT